MTTLHKAAQQALEALEAGLDVNPILAGEAEEALRSALAQEQEQEQAEPVATFDEVWDAIDWDKWRMEPIRELVRMIHSKTSPKATLAEPAREWVSMDEYKRLQGLVTSQGIRLMEYESKQPQQDEPVQAISECIAVLRPMVKGKFPHEQALDELVGYTAPPQRKPLTEEEIDAEWRELDGEVSTMFMRVLRKFARAIERAIWEKNK